MGGYLLGSGSELHVWWRFDPIDNVRGRLRLHVNGGKDLSINNVVELLGMFVAAWMFAKQSDVTLRFTLDNICFWCRQLTCPPYTGLGGGQWYHANVNACFRSYKGDQAQQGSVIERVRDRRLGGARCG